MEVDQHGSITYATGGLQSLLKRSEASLLGQPISSLTISDDSPIIEELLNRITLTGRVRDVAVRFVGYAAARVPVLVCGMKCPYDDAIIHLAARRAPWPTPARRSVRPIAPLTSSSLRSRLSNMRMLLEMLRKVKISRSTILVPR
jgi:hypothetical protein